MFYKEFKYLAAHRILNYLESCKVIVTKVGDEHLFSPTYQTKNLQEIPRFWYSMDILRDAAWMLSEANEIDFRANQRHLYDVNIKLSNIEGLSALREKKYIWLFLKSWKVIIIGLAALITAIGGISALIIQMLN